MNYRVFVFFASICCCFCTSLFATPFQNLDFEQGSIQAPPANYVPNPPWDPSDPFAISAAAGLPFWTARLDSTVYPAIWGGGVPLDLTAITLLSAVPIPPLASGFNPLNGNYSVQLSSAILGSNPSEVFNTSSISQTGDVPANAKSIQFLMVAGTPGFVPANPLVTLNGSTINLVPLATNGNLVTMAGDVSAFAGSNAQLTISVTGIPLAPNHFDRENVVTLDDISFSPNAIPEPSTVALLILGGVGLLMRRR